MPSSATSPSVRSFDTGIGGGADLQDDREPLWARADDLAGDVPDVGASSTRWKSSKISAAPSAAIVGSSAGSVDDVLARRALSSCREHRGVRVRIRIVLAAGGDQV